MHQIYEMKAHEIIIITFLLVATGTFGILLDSVTKAAYYVCTAKEHAFQSVFNYLYGITDDPEAKETLKLLNKGQQVSQSSINHLDKILKKKGYTAQEFLCKIANNNPPTENTEPVDCETLNGADGIDGFSMWDDGWAEICYETECENMPGADNVPGLTSNDAGWAEICYETECENMPGADNVPGLTSNDAGWTKTCYESRNHTSP